MSDLNDSKKVNDLIEALILAAQRSTVNIKVLKESTFTIFIDGIPYEFGVDFDPQTNLWFLEN